MDTLQSGLEMYLARAGRKLVSLTRGTRRSGERYIEIRHRAADTDAVETDRIWEQGQTPPILIYAQTIAHGIAARVERDKRRPR